MSEHIQISEEIYFIVPGECVPKQRPRFTTFRGHAQAYTPKKTLDYEKKVKNCYLKEYPYGMAFESEPVEIILNVYIAIPKSVSKKKRTEMLLNESPTKKNGDVDNYLKSVCDALNGVAYTDDCQIVTATVNKIWSESAQAEITLRSAIR